MKHPLAGQNLQQGKKLPNIFKMTDKHREMARPGLQYTRHDASFYGYFMQHLGYKHRIKPPPSIPHQLPPLRSTRVIFISKYDSTVFEKQYKFYNINLIAG